MRVTCRRRSTGITLIAFAVALAVGLGIFTATTVLAGPTSSSMLAECDTRRNVSVVPGELPPGAIAQQDAEDAARVIGVSGAAAVAVPARVSIGTDANGSPTQATALRDAHGKTILDRSAWVLVFRGQKVKLPGARTTSPRSTVSVAAGIVDASTGEFLRGWACSYNP